MTRDRAAIAPQGLHETAWFLSASTLALDLLGPSRLAAWPGRGKIEGAETVRLVPEALMKALLLIFLASAQLLGGARSFAEPAFDWPGWRGPEGDGVSRETGWNPGALKNPRILWRVDVGMGYSNVAIQGGRLHIVGYQGEAGVNVVRCLDAATGRESWRRTTSGPKADTSPQPTPAVSGADLFVLGRKGQLQCLNAENGGIRWQKDLVAEYGVVKPYSDFAGSPVVAGDLVILTANSAGMALDRKNGGLVWSSPPPPERFPAFDPSTSKGTYYSTPVLFRDKGEGFAVVAGWEGLSAVSVATGKRVWLCPWGERGWAEVPDPVFLEGGRVLTFPFNDYGQGEAVLVLVGSRKRKVLWRIDFAIMNMMTTPVVAGGNLYAVDSTAKMRCIDLRSGRQIGESEPTDTGGSASLSVTAAAGRLLILSSSGVLFIGEATSGGYREISRCELYGSERKPKKFWTPPVLCNGRIYCRNWWGDLFCIDVSK